jgi:hypothetical protein
VARCCPNTREAQGFNYGPVLPLKSFLGLRLAAGLISPSAEVGWLLRACISMLVKVFVNGRQSVAAFVSATPWAALISFFSFLFFFPPPQHHGPTDPGLYGRPCCRRQAPLLLCCLHLQAATIVGTSHSLNPCYAGNSREVPFSFSHCPWHSMAMHLDNVHAARRYFEVFDPLSLLLRF